MTQKKIDRINFLARKSRQTKLSEEEIKEQTDLRNEYRRDFMASMTGHLENITIVNPDGTKERVKDRRKD